MATFEFGWVGLLLVMTSGGFGAVGMLPLLGIGPDSDDQSNQLKAFIVFFVILSTIAATAAAVV
ncbi:hypothetical protein [Haloquadratum walsbyi]|jgi:hypothetical protein|uniref:Uncharacterized protein n=1 Tax=Haloquadratum walsbyi J07HQW2 TaxID=1238425 RepID=U1PT88_9EURY|nr:hypothetical protein [Haloquadratum walsbyi]ERG95591.1 MAG: hypothetical protein J07HQW2_02049 [Haloquadratum walsbyi J07HQW2]